MSNPNGIPTYAGQSGYTGQTTYTTTQSSYPGQTVYTSQPAYTGQTVYTSSQPTYTGQTVYTSQPAYTGQTVYTTQPTYTGQTVYTTQPAYTGSTYTTTTSSYPGQTVYYSHPGYTTTSYYPQDWRSYRTRDYSNYQFRNYGVTMSMVDNNAQRLFNYYDRDRSGALSLGELHNLLEQFMRECGLPPLDPDTVCALMYAFDDDNNGQISFNELEMMLASLGGRPFTRSMVQQYRTLPQGTSWRTFFRY